MIHRQPCFACNHLCNLIPASLNICKLIMPCVALDGDDGFFLLPHVLCVD